MRLPPGFAAGHWTDRERWTGCTAVLATEPGVAAAHVSGGGPGTRESELLTPAAGVDGVDAVLLSGGSAYGLGAADGVVAWLAERSLGHRTPSGALVPLVPAAIVFDLTLGEPAHPGPADARAACDAATSTVERGSVGAGTGCTVGKVLGPACATKGGLGAASVRIGEATLTAIAVVNSIGDVIAEDGSVLAGPRRDGTLIRTTALLRGGFAPAHVPREATTLVCVTTDATLTKTQAWLLARACTTGIARAVDPSGTTHDGDIVFALASCRVDADPMVLSALGAHAVSAAIRDAVRTASSAPGCLAVRDHHC